MTPPKQQQHPTQYKTNNTKFYLSLFGTCAAHPSGHQIAALPIKCTHGLRCGQRFSGRTSVPHVHLLSLLFLCLPHLPRNPHLNSLPSTSSQIASVFRLSFMFREKHLIHQGKIKSALVTSLTLPLTDPFNGQQWESLGPPEGADWLLLPRSSRSDPILGELWNIFSLRARSFVPFL